MKVWKKFNLDGLTGPDSVSIFFLAVKQDQVVEVQIVAATQMVKLLFKQPKKLTFYYLGSKSGHISGFQNNICTHYIATTICTAAPSV